MTTQQSTREGLPSRETFHPKGAIAFFAGMIVFYAALWLAMYALMAGRG